MGDKSALDHLYATLDNVFGEDDRIGVVSVEKSGSISTLVNCALADN